MVEAAQAFWFTLVMQSSPYLLWQDKVAFIISHSRNPTRTQNNQIKSSKQATDTYDDATVLKSGIFFDLKRIGSG